MGVQSPRVARLAPREPDSRNLAPWKIVWLLKNESGSQSKFGSNLAPSPFLKGKIDFGQLESQNQEISLIDWRNEALYENNDISHTALDFDRVYERR